MNAKANAFNIPFGHIAWDVHAHKAFRIWSIYRMDDSCTNVNALSIQFGIHSNALCNFHWFSFPFQYEKYSDLINVEILLSLYLTHKCLLYMLRRLMAIISFEFRWIKRGVSIWGDKVAHVFHNILRRNQYNRSECSKRDIILER